MGNGKRFMAYDINDRLKIKNEANILMRLQEGLTAKQIEKGQHHQVFVESFDAKPINHRNF